MKKKNKTRKIELICLAVLLCIGITACKDKPKAEVTKKNISSLLEISNPDTVKQTVTLYMDCSATKNELTESKVFEAIEPDLSQYCDTIKLVKREKFETHYRENETTLNNEIQKLNNGPEINYANIELVFDSIVAREEQAVFITDCEYIKADCYQDNQGYFGRHLTEWLQKGYSVDIITEPYMENGKEKKRFYFFFSDDKLVVPMINNCMEKLEPYMVDCPDSLSINKCYKFHMSNSDYSISSIIGDNANQKESYYEFDTNNNIITIKGKWKNIRSSVLCCDEHWKTKKGKEPNPIICLQLKDGSCYSIDDITISAKNISQSIVSQGKKADKDGFDDLIQCFIHKKEDRLVNIYFNPEELHKKLYTKKDFRGNVIRVDIYGKFSKKEYDENSFQWISIGKVNANNGKTAICVSESIGNALKDIEVVPSDTATLYTFFINLPSKD